jgi:hypothetical protein
MRAESPLARAMPSIDVHADAELFSKQDKRTIARELTEAALRAEGLEPSPFLLSKSWVFFHRYPASTVGRQRAARTGSKWCVVRSTHTTGRQRDMRHTTELRYPARSSEHPRSRKKRL